MFREQAKTLERFSFLLDMLCMVAAFAVALALRAVHADIPVLSNIPATAWDADRFVRSDYALLLATSAVACLLSLRFTGIYRSPDSTRPLRFISSYASSLVIAMVATAAIAFILKMGTISRVFLGYYFALAFITMTMKQTLFVGTLRRMRRTALHQRHALVIGSGKPASWFSRVLQDGSEAGYSLVGLVLSRNVMAAESFSVPIVGTLENLDRVLTEHPVDEVFVVGGAEELARLAPVAQTLIERGRVVSLVTPLSSGTHGLRGRATEFNGVPMISFGPMPRDEVGAGMKRAIDVVTASAAMFLLSPVMLLVALLISVLDPGPILFRQERLGRGGERFGIYKFRSMRADAEEALRSDARMYQRYVENGYKLPEDEDPRISRLGRFLRKTSLDELPQLWNVIRGEMSIVGPRPIVPAELENYAPYADLFLTTRPGLTGRWQVSGRSDIQYPERAFMDLDYVGLNSLLSDISIMLRTVPSVLLRRGAH